jgi:ribose transport system ATP-binding protein
MSEYILEMKNIGKCFFGVQVLKNINLNISSGEVRILAGENGAGKSTLIKILSGAYKRETGEIFLEGNSIPPLTPIESLNLGISIIYQEFNLVPYLSIYENIFLGKEYVKGVKFDKAKTIKESKKFMEKVGLNVNPCTLVSTLSVAQKQLVEIAKAISNDVKVLVFDEPTASITAKETKLLFQLIKDLQKKGIGIIYISHRMEEFFEIGTNCTVMRDGECIGTVDIKDTTEAEIIKMMVGRDVLFERVENKAVDYSETVLSVKNLSYKEVVKDVSFDLHKGEILGVAGLLGAGRTETAKCIMGAYKRTSGEVLYHGKPLSQNLAKNIDKGIVYLSEDRKDEGLILIHSLVENISLPNLKQVASPFLDKKKMKTNAEKFISKLRIKAASSSMSVNGLSGGNQQKVVIAKWLYSDPNIYIFDEPTRGIDVGAREEIYNIMSELVKEGNSIILISSDLVEVQKMSNRIVVMKEGVVSAVLENSDNLTQEEIFQYAL